MALDEELKRDRTARVILPDMPSSRTFAGASTISGPT